jgi:hypothetical protein
MLDDAYRTCRDWLLRVFPPEPPEIVPPVPKGCVRIRDEQVTKSTKICRHCGEPIEKLEWTLGGWAHSDTDGRKRRWRRRWCRGMIDPTVAEPVPKGVAAVTGEELS